MMFTMDFVFVFKKIVSRLIFPVPLVAYALLVGVCLIWFARTWRKRLVGKIVVTVGVVLFFTFGSGPVPDLMLRSLENNFEPFDRVAVETLFGTDWKPAFVVVLGGDHTPREDFPVTSRLGPRSTARLNEGLRLHQMYPDSTFVVTGGKIMKDQKFAIADDMAEIAESWGIPRDQIIVEDQSRDTKDHVKYLTEILGEKPFVLVTSASHMTRASGLFRKAGLQAFPAPVMFEAGEGGFSLGFKSLIPKASKFGRSEGAFYEYLGLAWATMRGQI